MARHLASVQVVNGIKPIPDADRIEIALVLGWQCVVEKGKFKVGDKAVYFEIDSFLPEKEEFEFLRKSSFKDSDILGKGFKLKTQKFRGCISQGLLMPLDELGITNDLQVGTDLTEQLGIVKWEVAERATTGGTIIGTLPDFIPKTDETRIQSEPELIDDFGDKLFYISTKMDGSSHSVGLDSEGVFHVCGHNFEYKDDDKSSFYRFVKKNEIEEKLRKYLPMMGFLGKEVKTIAIQGEFCGEGIQKNRLKLKQPKWYVFTVNVNDERVDLLKMICVCSMLGLDFVPIEEYGTDLKAKYPDVDSLLARAAGNYPNAGPKEGIVIRPVYPCYNERICASLSFKVINNQFLLKNED